MQAPLNRCGEVRRHQMQRSVGVPQPQPRQLFKGSSVRQAIQAAFRSVKEWVGHCQSAHLRGKSAPVSVAKPQAERTESDRLFAHSDAPLPKQLLAILSFDEVSPVLSEGAIGRWLTNPSAIGQAIGAEKTNHDAGIPACPAGVPSPIHRAGDHHPGDAHKRKPSVIGLLLAHSQCGAVHAHKQRLATVASVEVEGPGRFFHAVTLKPLPRSANSRAARCTCIRNSRRNAWARGLKCW